jgi:hypothetical protein
MKMVIKLCTTKQPMATEEIALLLKDSPDISATGANKFKFGFSDEK